MSIHLCNAITGGLPKERKLLRQLAVRLISDAERERFDQTLEAEHYLHNATTVGATLRYVAEYEGQWLALLVFASPALHLKARERWLHWDVRRLAQRRHLLAQNTRFLIRGAVHPIAVRWRGGRPLPLPRAGTWARLVAGELERFQTEEGA